MSAKPVDVGGTTKTQDESVDDNTQSAARFDLVAKRARVASNGVETTRSGSIGGDDGEKCANLLQRFVGTVHQRDMLRLVARYVPGHVAAQFTVCRRSPFTELPRDILTLVYSFGDVRAHFRLARCARLLRSVAYLPASSPAVVVVRSSARDSDGLLPASLSMLRPASLCVHRACVANMPQLAGMQTAVRTLDVVANWYEKFATADSDIAFWAPLQQFQNLASLGLTIRAWPETIAPLSAVGAQLTTLRIDMCVVHGDFDFSSLARCAHLVELRLADVELTDALGLKRLATCVPQLTRLTLKWEYEASERLVDLGFVSAFTQLRHLGVSSASRQLVLPSAMPFLEYASFKTKRLASPSSFRDWSALQSLKLPGEQLSDTQLPATLTHLDASALTACGESHIVELVAVPLRSLRRLIVARCAMSAPSAERPAAGATVLQRYVSASGSSLEIEWVDPEPRTAVP